MKQLAAIVMASIIILTGCSAKKDNIVFTAIVEVIHEEGMLVTTVDYDGFDKAFVSYSENMEGTAFNFIVGQELAFTVLPRSGKAILCRSLRSGLKFRSAAKTPTSHIEKSRLRKQRK